MMKNIIWTKENCPYCTEAKAMLDEEGVEYEVRLVDEKTWSFSDLLKVAPNEQTLPQIFLDEKHIGGCEDLEAYLALCEMGISV
jgi:glutaredoxin 3